MTPAELRDLVDLAAALGGDLVVDYSGDVIVDVAGDDFFKCKSGLFVDSDGHWMYYSRRAAASLRSPRISVGGDVLTIEQAREKLVDHAF